MSADDERHVRISRAEYLLFLRRTWFLLILSLGQVALGVFLIRAGAVADGWVTQALGAVIFAFNADTSTRLIRMLWNARRLNRP